MALPLVINRREGFTQSSVSTLATASASTTTGNLIWVWANAQNSGATITVTDTAGNTYTQIGTPVQSNPGGGGVNYGYQFYAKNITGNASNVVTMHGTFAGYTVIAMYEISGLDIVSPLVDNKTAAGTGNPAATASLTLSGSSIILAGTEQDGQSIVAGSGYTLTRITDGLGSYTADEYQITSTSQTASVTSGGGGWQMVAAAFKAASSVSPSTFTGVSSTTGLRSVTF